MLDTALTRMLQGNAARRRQFHKGCRHRRHWPWRRLGAVTITRAGRGRRTYQQTPTFSILR